MEDELQFLLKHMLYSIVQYPPYPSALCPPTRIRLRPWHHSSCRARRLSLLTTKCDGRGVSVPVEALCCIQLSNSHLILLLQAAPTYPLPLCLSVCSSASVSVAVRVSELGLLVGHLHTAAAPRRPRGGRGKVEYGEGSLLQ